jgi:hypothetical protein
MSIFDGRTEYRLAEMLTNEVRPGILALDTIFRFALFIYFSGMVIHVIVAGHKGGIYVCDSLLDLLGLSPLPSKSACIDYPWAGNRSHHV